MPWYKDLQIVQQDWITNDVSIYPGKDRQNATQTLTVSHAIARSFTRRVLTTFCDTLNQYMICY
jgi:hypothetical protein